LIGEKKPGIGRCQAAPPVPLVTCRLRSFLVGMRLALGRCEHLYVPRSRLEWPSIANDRGTRLFKTEHICN
jgi:hypothetical protein